MRNALEKMTELINAVTHLQEDEAEFIASYLQDISHELRHLHHGHNHELLDLSALWNQFGSASYSEFVKQLLKMIYENDDYHTVSRVCGCLYGPLPETEAIKEILLTGIWDTQKSNRLRERFFWCFNYHFKESSITFFSEELGRFIQENAANEELMADIIDFLHWNMKGTHQLGEIRIKVLSYLNEHPNVIVNIHSPATKKILDIA